MRIPKIYGSRFALSAVLALIPALVFAFALAARAQEGPAEAVPEAPPADEKPAEPGADQAPPPEEFDVHGGSDEELSAAQAIAELERRRQRRRAAIARTKIDYLQSYEYDLTGKDQKELVREATVRALKSTASRIYFGDYLLIGRDLLEPYLRVYGERFVVRQEIVARQVLADNMVRIRLKVGVDVDSFYQDLKEKRFLAQPKVRPIVAVLLSETQNGQPVDSGRGRQILEKALTANEQRVESERMTPFGLGLDASANEEISRAAREEAQRADVDILVTGALTTQLRGENIILFDQVFYTDAKLDLKFIRVDTGEVMREKSERYSASGGTAEASLSNLLDTVLPRAAGDLSAGFLDEWANVILDKGDYRLVINGISPPVLTSVENMLKGLSPDVRLFVKAYYGDVVTLNVYYPGSNPKDFAAYLRKSRVPQFRIRSADERHLELDVL